MKPVLNVWDLLFILVCILGCLTIIGIFFGYIPYNLSATESYAPYLLLGIILLAFNGWFFIIMMDKFLADESIDNICRPKQEKTKTTFVEKIVNIIIGAMDRAAFIVLTLESGVLWFLIVDEFFRLFKRDYIAQLENVEPINRCVCLLAIAAFILLLLGLYAAIAHTTKQYSLDLKKDIKLLNDNCEKMAAEIKSLKENSLK